MKRPILCFSLVFSFGFILLICGIALWVVLPYIVHKQVSEFLPLKNNTLIYNQWHETSLPVFMSFYYFNIVNSKDVEQGHKPYVTQKGPYVYREHRVKENIQFNENGTVTYEQRRYFEFDAEKSIGLENDTITTLNLPLLVIGEAVANSFLEKKTLEFLIEKCENLDIFMSLSVKNLTWGYEDPFLKKYHDILSVFMKRKIDPVVGLFYGKNDTTDGVYTVDSGLVNLDNFLRIYEWQGSDHLNIWYTKYANQINGTDGSMFPPFLNTTTGRLYTYQTDICRSIYADYTESSIVKGIPSYKYRAPSMLFADHNINKDNIGFCVDGKCLGSGVLNMSKCIGNAPVIMSQPHYYQADSKYRDEIDGLLPESPDLGTVLEMEPITGLPLNLQKKLQINLVVEPISGFAKMDKLQRMFLPMMWLNESAIIDDDLADKLKSMLIIPQFVTRIVAIIAMVIGGFMVLSSTVVMIVHFCRNKPDSGSIQYKKNHSQYEKLENDNNGNNDNGGGTGDSGDGDGNGIHV